MFHLSGNVFASAQYVSFKAKMQCFQLTGIEIFISFSRETIVTLFAVGGSESPTVQSRRKGNMADMHFYRNRAVALNTGLGVPRQNVEVDKTIFNQQGYLILSGALDETRLDEAALHIACENMVVQSQRIAILVSFARPGEHLKNYLSFMGEDKSWMEAGVISDRWKNTIIDEDTKALLEKRHISIYSPIPQYGIRASAFDS